MEQTVAYYQHVIKQLLLQYEQLVTDRSDVVLLFDDEHMHYMALRIGWLNQRRIHFSLVHIEISDDIVIIQCNNTEDLIAAELIELGIPPERIRLGFLPPEHQEYAKLPTNQWQLEPA